MNDRIVWVYLTWIVIITVLVVTEMNAQIISGLGLKTGLTLANQQWSNPVTREDQSYLSGGTAGFFAEFFNTEIFNLVTEVAFTQKGMRDKSVFVGNSGVLSGGYLIYDNRLDYLSFNLLSKFQYHYKTLAPYLIAGPRYDVLLHKHITRLFSPNYESLKNTGFGLSAGGGVELLFRPFIYLLAEIRYNHDFKPAVELETLNIRNKSFDVRIGLKLDLGT